MKNFDSIDDNRGRGPQVSVQNGFPPQTRVPLTSAGRGKRARKIFKWFFALIIIVIIALGAYVFSRASSLSAKIFVGQKTTFWQKVTALVRGPAGSSSGGMTTDQNGQINILLLGVGGEGHDGPYLTDTMILAQIRPGTGEVVLTSIPRDYLVTLPDGYGQQKINAAFAYGLTTDNNMDWNQGGQWAIDQAEQLSGLSIPYFAVIDFSGFTQAIDQVGGVDVDVQNTFTDYAYPDSGDGYLPPVTFTAGEQHMDGARALEFARSRHAAGIEGSDFARSQRQQKIIAAFEAKVFTDNVIKDAGTLNSLLGIFADHFHTNISPAQIYQLYTLSKSKNISPLALSLDPSTGLICPEIEASDGAYILTPCPGKNVEDIQNYFKNAFSVGKLAAENSTVWLANSTGDQQIYDTAFRDLTDAGLTVYQLDYSQDNLPQTIVYQADPKPATAEFIENTLNATEDTLPPPGVTVPKGKVDVIVVLGENAPSQPAPTPYVPPAAETTTPPSSTLNSLMDQ
jgi:LCP family protein required for cell wall assembly